MADGKRFSGAVATTWLVVAIGASSGLPTDIVAQPGNPPPPQQENFQLSYQRGDPSFSEFGFSVVSPNVFEVMQQDGIDVDYMLEQAGQDIEWLTTRAGTTSDFLLERSEVSADFLLGASGESLDWLVGRLDEDADWILARSGKNIVWLLNRTGGTADRILDWAEKDADWLRSALGKDVDWILEQSGYGVSSIFGWAELGNDWVADVVKDLVCSELPAGRGLCEDGVDAASNSLSWLLNKAEKDGDWWLDKAGKDVDWLLAKAGKSADWMLHEAGRDRIWLWNRFGHDADWLLGKIDRNRGWLVTFLGHDVDWLLEQTDQTKSWLFAEIGGTTDWLLEQTNRDADWVLEQAGWRMQEAELTFELAALLQVKTGSGVSLSYPGGSRLQYIPGTPETPEYELRIGFLRGTLVAVDGLGATSAYATGTYTDPAGLSASAGADAGIVNQDLLLTIDEERMIMRELRHADGWLLTLCIPVKEIAAALSVEVPPVSAAALFLVPDIMITFRGDAGIRFESENTSPSAYEAIRFNLPEPQSWFEFPMQFQAEVVNDVRLNNVGWGFAWGMMCGPGVGISYAIEIAEDRRTLSESDPWTMSDQVMVRFRLRPPSDMPRDSVPPSAPGAGTQPPQQPGMPGAAPKPVPRPGTSVATPGADAEQTPGVVQPAPQRPTRPQPAPQRQPEPQPSPPPAQQPQPQPEAAQQPQPAPQPQSAPQPAPQPRVVTLEVNALNDRPGPVTLRVLGADGAGRTTVDTRMQWRANDNRYSTQSIRIPVTTKMIRLTFVNDYYRPGHADTDRNAFIDYLVWNGRRIEAESFDQTGGRPGERYAGCGRRQEAGSSGGFVADCGNQGDYVAYAWPGTMSQR